MGTSRSMRRTLAAACLISFCATGTALATNYYINTTTGVDSPSRSGLNNTTQAWATLGYAVARVPNGSSALIPNVIHVAAGTYARTYNDDASNIITLTTRKFIHIKGVPSGGVRPLINGECVIPETSLNNRWSSTTVNGQTVYRTNASLCAYCSSPCGQDGCTSSDPIEPSRFTCYLTYGGRNYLLLNYGDSANTTEHYGWDNFTADHEDDVYWEDDASQGHVYMGPGVIFDRNGVLEDPSGHSDPGRLYIRLDAPLYDEDFPNLPSFDPDQLELHFSDNKAALKLAGAPTVNGGTHHITVSDLDFHMFELQIYDSGSGNGTGDIAFENCSFRGMPLNKNAINGNCSGISFTNVEFEGAEVPKWITWDDVKTRPTEPSNGPRRPRALNYENRALQIASNQFGDPSGIEFEDCTFKYLWDGLVINAAGRRHDIYVSGCAFLQIRDDCVQLASSVWNFEFDHNLVQGPGAAVSRSYKSGSAGEEECEDEGPCYLDCHYGTKWIHHNVIDCREWQRFHRQKNDDPSCVPGDFEWSGSGVANGVCSGHGWLAPFEYHADLSDIPTEHDPRNIYNNTVLYGPNHYGAGYAFYNVHTPTKTKHRVFNNIFVVDYRDYEGIELTDGYDVINGNLKDQDDTPLAAVDKWDVSPDDDEPSMLLAGNIFWRFGESENLLWTSVLIDGTVDCTDGNPVYFQTNDFDEFNDLQSPTNCAYAPWHDLNVFVNPVFGCLPYGYYWTVDIPEQSSAHNYYASGDNDDDCVRGPALLGLDPEEELFIGAFSPHEYPCD